MSLNLHFYFFPENVGDVTDEHCEKFHQNIAAMEDKYKGKCKANMIADYYWFLKRDTSGSSHKRKANTSTSDLRLIRLTCK